MQTKAGTGMHLNKTLYKAQVLKQYEVIVEGMTEYLSHNNNYRIIIMADDKKIIIICLKNNHCLWKTQL